MPTVLAVNIPERAVRALERTSPEWGVSVEASEAGTALRRLEEQDADVVVMMLGDVTDPIRTIQQANLTAPDVPIVLVGGKDHCARMREHLRLAPFVGRHVSCVADEPRDELVAHLRAAVTQAQRLRRHHRMLARLNERLVSERRETSRGAEALLGKLLELAPIGVALVDERGVVTAVNPRAQELLGPETEVLGRRLADLLVSSDRPRLAAFFDDVSGATTVRRKAVFRVLHAARDLELTAARLTTAAGGPGMLVLLEDATERVELVEQLRAVARRKDEFLAMLGHELRNPLAPIRTALELMRMQGSSGVERERAIVEKHVAHLVQLVDDLLDVARIARGKVQLQRQRVEAATFVGDAVEMAAPLIEERRHELIIDVPRAGVAVEVDRRRMAQVVANLLTNAAKYTTEGGRITLRARRDGDRVTVTVADTGKGIDPRLLPHIFELFVQESQGLDRPTGGLGLGLAIVSNLVALHGGRVEVKSELGRGSEFRVELPGAADAPVTASDRPTGPAHRTPAGDQIRVLIVDDNQDAALLLEDLLRTVGYLTAVAHDAAAALRTARQFRPDVALLDIGLPVMSGLELGEHLAALPELAGIQLVAVTGYGTEEDRTRSRAIGFVEHLVKPVEADRLFAALDRAAARRRV